MRLGGWGGGCVCGHVGLLHEERRLGVEPLPSRCPFDPTEIKGVLSTKPP